MYLKNHHDSKIYRQVCNELGDECRIFRNIPDFLTNTEVAFKFNTKFCCRLQLTDDSHISHMTQFPLTKHANKQQKSH